MNKLMTTKRYLTAFAAVALVQTVFFYTSFFVNLESTLSEWSAFGTIWPIQLFHNFLCAVTQTDLTGYGLVCAVHEWTERTYNEAASVTASVAASFLIFFNFISTSQRTGA